MPQDHEQRFVDSFRQWALAACGEWGYSEPSETYFQEALKRIPVSIRAWVGKGLDLGVVVPDGFRFRLAGLKAGKGPYAWFSKSPSQEPAPNWEYYVQVAEYVRLQPMTEAGDIVIDFEDRLMDISLYRSGRLLVCVEIKESAEQIRELMSSVTSHQERIDWTGNDRGNDPLRKAKYIVEKRPRYFSAVAPGMRETYRVEFPESKEFELVPDFLPPIA